MKEKREPLLIPSNRSQIVQDKSRKFDKGSKLAPKKDHLILLVDGKSEEEKSEYF